MTGSFELLQPGVRAPPFSLAAAPDRRISLGDAAGRALALVFYPADFSPVCGDELAVINELVPDFEGLGARVLGVSVDGVWTHRAFARERHLRFPLLADFNPKGEVSRRYAAYREADGFSERALVVIDGSGFVFWSYLSPIEVNPGADGILDAFERLARRRESQEARQ